MKKVKLLSLFLVLALFSCSKDDSSEESSKYPRVVNLKFEAIGSSSNFGYVDVIFNNETELSGQIPFNETMAQIEVEEGTFLKMDFFDQPYQSDYPYTVALKIYENNAVIAEKNLTISEHYQTGYLEYTFN